MKIEKTVFHICNKSIANYSILNSDRECGRFMLTLRYYNNITLHRSLSKVLQNKLPVNIKPVLSVSDEHRVKILAYCLMPDHYHLLLRTESTETLSKYMNDVENSYSRFLNIKRKRKGPLWQSRFRRVLVDSDAQLLHVSRYIHLNPTTAYLCKKPEEWKYSSYRSYIENPEILKSYVQEMTMQKGSTYRKFAEDQIDYQRKLKFLKKHLI